MADFVNIKGYEGIYQISKKGDIKTCNRVIDRKNGRRQTFKSKILIPYISTTGYYFVKLVKNKHRNTFAIHRLVCKTFIKNPKNKPCVNHKDGNKLNNNVENLEWCTHSENHRHAYKIGLMKPAMKGRVGKNSPTGMPVVKCDLNGIKISEYGSVRQAALKNNISPVTIGRCLKNRQNTSGGFVWKRP